MYALAPSSTSGITKRKRTTPNLLPCTIHHNGPVPTSARYWSPTTNTALTDEPSDMSAGRRGGRKAETKTSYFRGRKLLGRTVRVPTGYTGLVLQKTSKALPVKPEVPTAEELRALEEGDMNGDDEEMLGGGRDEEVEVKMLEQQAEFDEMIIWGHEAPPDGAEDVYVRGVEEWVAFAEAVGVQSSNILEGDRADQGWQMHCDDESSTTDTNGTTT